MACCGKWANRVRTINQVKLKTPIHFPITRPTKMPPLTGFKSIFF
ncbi:hypothetical protein FLA_2700 [Filimonas lacunae]|nr:hypothetical protein FLA_2700 [Filimonas lacunae]